jgi:hypothetical protein
VEGVHRLLIRGASVTRIPHIHPLENDRDDNHHTTTHPLIVQWPQQCRVPYRFPSTLFIVFRSPVFLFIKTKNITKNNLETITSKKSCPPPTEAEREDLFSQSFFSRAAISF